MHAPRFSAGLRLFAAVALVAACNSAAGTTAPGSTTGTTPAAGSTPEATQATPSQGPGASVDLGGAAAGLSNLTSYKLSMVTGTASVEATVVNGPPKARQVTEIGSTGTVRVVQIGTDVWFDPGNGTFIKNALPAAAVDDMFKAFDPAVFMANLLRQAPQINSIPPVGVETKNGVQATHIHADSSTQLPAGASPIPAGSVFDLWVAVDGGYLVALEATGVSASGGDVKLELTNINDPTLSVTPPA
jgi:hypothetical protein